MKTDKRLLIYPAAFLVNAGITMLNFSLIFFMRRHYGTSPGFIGWLSAFWALAYLAGCLGLGGISRRLSYRGALPLATFIMGVSVLLILIIPSETGAFFLYILFGLITALHWPPLMGWLSESLEGAELNRAVGGFNISWSTGAGSGPFIAGFLVERSISLPLLVITGLYWLVTLLYIAVFVFARTAKAAPVSLDIPGPSASRPADNSSPLRFAGWIGVMSAYTLLGTILFIFPMYAEDVLHYSESFTGMLLFLRGVITVAGFYAAGKTLFWHNNPRQITFSQIILGATALLLAVSSAPWAYLLLFTIFGIVFALQYATSIFHGVSGSIDRERRMAVHESALTIGIVLGSAGGGLLYEKLSFKSVLLLVALLIFLFALAQLFTFKNKTFKKKTAS